MDSVYVVLNRTGIYVDPLLSRALQEEESLVAACDLCVGNSWVQGPGALAHGSEVGAETPTGTMVEGLGAKTQE